MKKASDIGMLQYFYEEKGDLTRYVAWEKIKGDYPEVVKALEDLQHAEMVFKLILNSLSPDIEDMD